MNITPFPAFGAIPIIVSNMALKETTERLFPVSRHRSKRIHKKLVKRFGGEFRTVPVVLRTKVPALRWGYTLSEQDLRDAE